MSEERNKKVVSMGMDNPDEPKVPFARVDLPAGYLLEKDDEVFVLDQATMREITGDEEDIMSEDNMSTSERLHAVINACLTSLSDKTGEHVVTDRAILSTACAKLLMSDILVLIFALRRATCGNELRFQARCPECAATNKNTKQTVIVDTDQLDVAKLEGDPKRRVRELKTSRGKTITWEMLTGAGEILHRSKKKKGDRATASLLMRVRTIDGQPATREMLKKMSKTERDEIRFHFDEEGGIDTDWLVTCRECEEEYDAQIVVDSNFFTRSDLQPGSKKKSST